MSMVLSRRMQVWKIVLASWILLTLVLCTFPWWVEAPQWWRIRWIPLLDAYRSPRLLRDAIANCLLYMPFGFAYTRACTATGMSSIWQAAIAGLLLSMTCELYQVFSPVRYPTMTDVLMNTVGALVGASIAGTSLAGRKSRSL
jgi:glycopeptide antibiotics resistance protein